ncbi:hypothetical protein FGG08_000596 [Glutinoglossum americanum]|uniref:Uncharacterized protein n=1 Tax=Glutinoglossum americanum TaxID=1670608 RepID=A0A9P8I9X2_9PEZI|nr:hypothetical protein FGG08_000596 [Glutinoglossum americanum]
MASKVLENVLRSRNWSYNSIGTIRHTRSFAKRKLPTFPPTSSPELDKLLRTYRDTIFIPSLLPERYQQLIYKTKHRQSLLSEPRYVDIPCDNGEVLNFRLSPIDRLTDVPTSKVTEVLSLMKTPADYDAIVPFLQGLHQAGRKLHMWQAVRIARWANDANRSDVVVDCARRAKTTGFLLSTLEVARAAIRGPYQLAKGGDVGQVKKAMGQAEQLIELLESPLHAGVLGLHPAQPRAQPDIVGVALAVAAIQASKYNGGSDVDGKVASYANRMKGTWANADLKFNAHRELALSPARRLMAWAPALHGARLARDILSAESAEGAWISEVLPQMEEELEQVQNRISMAPREYDELQGVDGGRGLHPSS